VNTLSKLADGTLQGDNTDGAGLVRDLTVNAGVELAGKRILILGAGGAVRGVLEPILAHQPQSLVIANRTVEKAEQLAREFDELGPVVASGFAWLQEPVDVIINATSASLAGELPPIADSLVEAGRTVCYDMMYARNRRRSASGLPSWGRPRFWMGWGCWLSRRRKPSLSGVGYDRIRRRCLLNCAASWLGADICEPAHYPCRSGLAPRTPAKPVPCTVLPSSRDKPAPTGIYAGASIRAWF
jgi:hypothetical protein